VLRGLWSLLSVSVILYGSHDHHTCSERLTSAVRGNWLREGAFYMFDSRQHQDYLRSVVYVVYALEHGLVSQTDGMKERL
jgi:hypothetical protein